MKCLRQGCCMELTTLMFRILQQCYVILCRWHYSWESSFWLYRVIVKTKFLATIQKVIMHSSHKCGHSRSISSSVKYELRLKLKSQVSCMSKWFRSCFSTFLRFYISFYALKFHFVNFSWFCSLCKVCFVKPYS